MQTNIEREVTALQRLTTGVLLEQYARVLGDGRGNPDERAVLRAVR